MNHSHENHLGDDHFRLRGGPGSLHRARLFIYPLAQDRKFIYSLTEVRIFIYIQTGARLFIYMQDGTVHLFSVCVMQSRFIKC